MSVRISHSPLDPLIGPKLKALYPKLHIPAVFPPEGIVLVGHALAFAGAVGFAFSLEFWWGGLLAAAGILGNHTADCIDGTHARATGQCRHGGELLDHFTDPLSFSYWLVGIALAIGQPVWGMAALIVLFGHAVLTNIKAKLVDRFELARFGPTEFKTLLATAGIVLSGLNLYPGGTVDSLVARYGFFALVIGGGVGLLVQLVRAVAEVNRSSKPVDDQPWVITGPGSQRSVD